MNETGLAVLARHHKGQAVPASEFAALVSIAGYASFDAALDAYEASPIEVADGLGMDVSGRTRPVSPGENP